MYNITKREAEQFLKDQENIGDYCAFTELRAAIAARVTEAGHPLPDAEKTMNLCEALANLTWVIVEMEMGNSSWDSRLNDWYRDGVCLLIDECIGRN